MSNVIEFTVRAIDDFTAVMSKTERQFSGFEKLLGTIGVTAAAYKAIDMAKTSLDNAEAMGVAAEKANMAVETFSALTWAAQQSNTTQAALTTGLRMLGREMSAGNKTLTDLGIAATDTNGQLRPTVDVLLDLSDKFNASRQDANKTRAAMELFGRSGVEMVPLLNQGRDAIEKMMQEAKQLGFVISGDFSKSADQINDNLAAMDQIMRGQVNVAMEQLAPTIELLTGEFIDMAKEGGAAEKMGNALAISLKAVFTVGMLTYEAFGYLTTGLSQIVTLAAAAGRALSGDVAGALGLVNVAATSGRDANDELAKSLERLKGMWDGTAQSAAAASAKQMRAAMDKAESLRLAKKDEEAAAEATKKHKEEMRALVDALETANDTFGLSADQLKLYQLMVNGADEALIRIAADAVAAGMAQEEAAKKATFGTIEYKNAAQDASRTLSEMFAAQQREMGSVAFQTAKLMHDTFNNLAKGVGDAVASALVDSASLLAGIRNVLKQVLKDIISNYVTMQLEQMIFAKAGAGIQAKTATSRIAMSAGEAYAATWADVAQNMPYGWAYGEAIAAGVAKRVVAGGEMYVTGGGIAGIAHGGMDNVPSESTFLLDKGERVLSPRQNTDLTEFLASENRGGGMTIQNLTIHILENATNTDAFARMDRIAIRNALGQPVIDALNEMWKLGIQPNFAARKV